MPSSEPTEGRCNATVKQGEGYCESYPVGDGDRCRMHGGDGTKSAEANQGNQNAVDNDGGAPLQNQNANSHSLRADITNYYDHLDEEGQAWIFELTETFLDRFYTRYGEPDMADRMLMHKLAVKSYISAQAADVIGEDGVSYEVAVEDDGAEYNKKMVNPVLAELRYYDREIFDELDRMGLLVPEEGESTTAEQRFENSEYEIILEPAEPADTED